MQHMRASAKCELHDPSGFSWYYHRMKEAGLAALALLLEIYFRHNFQATILAAGPEGMPGACLHEAGRWCGRAQQAASSSTQQAEDDATSGRSDAQTPPSAGCPAAACSLPSGSSAAAARGCVA